MSDHIPDRLGSERARDDGFGLVEIIVSMFVLATLAIALLPVLVTGIKQSAVNSTLATATQLVNRQMQLAQSSGSVCANLGSLAGTTALTDNRGVIISVTTTVGTCPAGVGTVEVSAVAVRTDTGNTLAEAQTLVFVQ